MHLRSSPASPYTRKVKIAAAILGLADRVEDMPTNTDDPASPLRQQNPLGKIPTLILDDGSALYDSRVIVEYLDHLAGGGRLFPLDARERFETLKLQALADGICDAALLIRYESVYRTEQERSASWVARQQEKVDRSLLELDTVLVGDGGKKPKIGDIAAACALGYLDLRFEGRWRTTHPLLVAWLDAFASSQPSFEATRVTP